MSGESEFDVIIVGAGISGLSAAYQLKKKKPDCKILVLEAKDRVGGRTLSLELTGARGVRERWDLGGQWVGRTQTHILDLMEELGLEKSLQYTNGSKFMQLGNNRIRSYNSSTPPLSFIGLIDLQLGLSKIEKMRKQVPIDNPAACKHAEKWDSTTLETFKQQTLKTKGAKDAFDVSMRAVAGMECREISLLSFLFYANSGGGLMPLVEATEGAAQEYKIKGGAQQVSERLVDKIGKEKVLLGEVVEEIVQEDALFVSIKTSTGKEFMTQRVIVAAPPHCTGQIRYKPELPPERRHLIQRTPVGHLLKFIITYETAFWREAGYSGEIVSNGGPTSTKGCNSGPLCAVFDATTDWGSPALVGFFSWSRQWSEKTVTVRQEAVLQHLKEFFGEKALTPIQYIDKDWSREPYNGGCPVNMMMPGAISLFHGALRRPFNRVHWACTENATVWCGYMSGAVQSGIHTANQVLHSLSLDLVSEKEIKLATEPPSYTPTPNKAAAK